MMFSLPKSDVSLVDLQRHDQMPKNADERKEEIPKGAFKDVVYARRFIIRRELVRVLKISI